MSEKSTSIKGFMGTKKMKVIRYFVMIALLGIILSFGVTAFAWSNYTVENGVLTDYQGNDSYITIPSYVTSIANGAFQDCTNLVGVTIPNTVTSIGYGAFMGCTNLTSVSIPSSVNSIGMFAFDLCSSLTSGIGNLNRDQKVYQRH